MHRITVDLKFSYVVYYGDFRPDEVIIDDSFVGPSYNASISLEQLLEIVEPLARKKADAFFHQAESECYPDPIYDNEYVIDGIHIMNSDNVAVRSYTQQDIDAYLQEKINTQIQNERAAKIKDEQEKELKKLKEIAAKKAAEPVFISNKKRTP